jgi:hypothetical protein
VWRTTYGPVELIAEVLRLGRRGRLLHSLRVGRYSKKLQRALTDFGAEDSFLRAALRLQEHYGIEVSSSAIRRITFAHGRKIGPAEPAKAAPEAKVLVTEMDGSLIPVVQPGTGGDRRKAKTLLWREVRLCCARDSKQTQRIYGATLGSVENASWMWRQTAQRAGLGERTYVHGVGDGAGWIVDRFKENFGGQGNYLLDFFHVSEYLSGAGVAIRGPVKFRAWFRRQQGRLLNNQWEKVLCSLQKHLEPPEQTERPVRLAYRYLLERKAYLNFETARRRNLPIGSGEIESSHRHIIQKRLKLAGSWWLEPNAQIMLNLRTARANNDWLAYWNTN